MSEIVELLRQLVAIDSINPDLVPGGAGEAEIARFVAGWLERAGLEVELDEPAPGRPRSSSWHGVGPPARPRAPRR